MTQCSHCQTELFTEALASGRDICCASCGQVIARELLGGGNKYPYRDAWLSLFLGISSIIFACFAGIPAVYLGIRALLRMKYRPATIGARRAAIWGIFTGGLFGILMGGTLMAAATLVLLFRMTTEMTTDPERSLEVLNEIAVLDVDFDHIKPQQAIHSKVLLSLVQLVDSPKRQQRTVIIKLLRLPTWVATNRAQFTGMLRDEYLHPARKYQREKTEQLTWNINGQDIAVTKIVLRFEQPGDDAEAAVRTMQYYFLTDIGIDTYGLVLIHQPPDSKLNENDVQQIFESFQAVQ